MADPNTITRKASPLGSETEAATPALDAGSNLPDTEEDKDDDSGSVHTTTTDDLFAKDMIQIRGPPEPEPRKLGLHYTRPWGWSGSAYDDYEYEDDSSICL